MDETLPDAVAWSTDGVTFDYLSPIRPGISLGGYVAVYAPSGQLVGQLLTQRAVERDRRHMIEGAGRFLQADGDTPPFDGAPVTPAPAALLEHRFPRHGGQLEVGRLRNHPELPALLEAKGFNRHTFLCGQSGSGKTYALGGLLEQLVLHTRLPLLVLDPNGDHVHLGGVRSDVDAEVAAAYATAASDVRVLQAGPAGEEASLRIRLRDLGEAGAAALLQLDPVADRREYNALLHGLRDAGEAGFASVEAVFETFRSSGDDVLESLRLRAENLGIDRMGAWAGRTARTIGETWSQDGPRALVADTSGAEDRRERIAIAVAVLEHLWRERKRRQPLLLVVDEAHDVCPAEPDDTLQRLAVDLFTRIAGEGRKYGIHLLLASQRPDKLPDNVLSQCDNLLLMRVNSAGDRHALAQRFGFAPPDLVELSGTFGLGETLLAGQISPGPQLSRTGARLTPEGGADVATDWVAG